MLVTITETPLSSLTNQPGVISLSDLQPGELGKVVSFSGGRTMIARMAALGFTPGAVVTLLQNNGHGPVIASVRGGRIALGRQEAQKTLVERCK